MFLPPLNPADADLLTRYLLAHEDLHTLLSQPNAPALLPLLDFLAHPDITPWLDHYRAIMAHARQNAALNALSDVLRQTTDPTQRRLAATALLHNRTPRPPRPEPQRSDPRAPRTPQDPRRTTPSTSPLDASMPPCLDAFPDISHRTPEPIAPPPTAPSLAQPLATLNFILNDPDAALDRELDAQLGAELDADIHADIHADIDDDIDRDGDDDDTQTDDPLLAAALTGDPDAIHRFYVERTGHPPDPILAASLSRALQPTRGPSG